MVHVNSSVEAGAEPRSRVMAKHGEGVMMDQRGVGVRIADGDGDVG